MASTWKRVYMVKLVQNAITMYETRFKNTSWLESGPNGKIMLENPL
jgi:hypothetical protein